MFMKKEIIIPFDGDFSQESRDRLVCALEEQLEKLNTNNGEDEGSSKGVFITRTD